MDIDESTSFIGGGHKIDENNDYDDDDDDNDNDDIINFEDNPDDEKILITQNNKEYIASSKVDDYKYRPIEYKNVSLYDWARSSSKQSNKIQTAHILIFLPGHSQRTSHKVKYFSSKSNKYILNFIGGTLPRHDQGDFEYYCCTMLTLFKPWRTSDDLKNKNQTWSEAFTIHQFNLNDKKIMNNFNLRYECLDERDDYNAILKRQSNMNQNVTFEPNLSYHEDKKFNYATTASTFTQLKNTLFQPLLSNYYLQNTFSTTSNNKKLKILISLITLFKNFPLTKNKNELFVL